jgi:hypothetical protein
MSATSSTPDAAPKYFETFPGHETVAIESSLRAAPRLPLPPNKKSLPDPLISIPFGNLKEFPAVYDAPLAPTPD